MGEGHGYGWLLLDVVAGALMIDLVPRAIAGKVRLGGHIFAGIRFVMASLQGSPAPKLAGLPAGLFLFAYTFASPFLPSAWLSPASILVLSTYFSRLRWPCLALWPHVSIRRTPVAITCRPMSRASLDGGRSCSNCRFYSRHRV